jgi:3-oxoacyl-[acyl-carrier-protein] synthase II
VAITGVGTAAADRQPDALHARAVRAERVTQLALAAAGEALAAAGLAVTEGPPRPAIGVALGTAFGCFLTNHAYQRRLREGGPAVASPRLFSATVSNAAAGEIGIAWRLGGPAVTLSAGGASGLVALGCARDMLLAGRADAMVAGGMDAVGPALERWLAGAGVDPGFPPREDAGVLVLERPEAARTRGAASIGSLDGCGMGFEPQPEGPRAGDGIEAAAVAALAEAGCSAARLALVVTAAPPALASAEDRALLRIGASPGRLAAKRLLGETFGAAGPLAVRLALETLRPGGTALVLDACSSGHAAAVVVSRAGPPSVDGDPSML